MILYGVWPVARFFSFRNSVFNGAVISCPSRICSVSTWYVPVPPARASPSENSSSDPSEMVSSDESEGFSDGSSSSSSGSCGSSVSSSGFSDNSPADRLSERSSEGWFSSPVRSSSGKSFCVVFWSGSSGISETAELSSWISLSEPSVISSCVSSAALSAVTLSPSEKSAWSFSCVFCPLTVSSTLSWICISSPAYSPLSSESEPSVDTSSSTHAAADAGTTLPSSSRTSGSGSSAGIFSSSSISSCCSMA